MASEDEVEVILDRELPDEITYVNKSYSVTEPWMLGWVEVKEESHGVGTTRGYNVVYSQYVPLEVDKQPSLLMRYDLPFWEMDGGMFEGFKKRVIKFSQYANRINEVREEDLDDLRSRLTGEWYDSDM